MRLASPLKMPNVAISLEFSTPIKPQLTGFNRRYRHNFAIRGVESSKNGV
jgi:hypothetical protein